MRRKIEVMILGVFVRRVVKDDVRDFKGHHERKELWRHETRCIVGVIVVENKSIATVFSLRERFQTIFQKLTSL